MLVDLVRGLVSLNQKLDRPDKPNNGLLMLAEFFSTLLRSPRPSVDKVHGKTSSCHTRGKHCTDYPAERKARYP